MTALVSGEGAIARFASEGGGHRWQRIPPTEKRGRVQSSSVTVAALPEPAAASLVLRDNDLEWRTVRGSGAGGQKRNKTESAVQLTHKPTGTMVRVESERSQHQNKATALSLLRARIGEREQARVTGERNDTRRNMLGSGQRGDKIRTVQVRHGIVTDHRTGKKIRYDDYLRGRFEGLV